MNQEIDDLILDLEGVLKKKTFGMDGYAVGRRVFGGWWEGRLVLKLPTKARDKVMALDGASLFDPMGGRPMKEWVVLPQLDSEAALAFAREARDYARE